MSRMLTSIFMIGTVGYVIFKFRYRLLNIFLGTGWIRRIAIGSVMGIPGIKRRMLQSVFGGPS
ncbi:MAG: hypothetical protein Q8934_11515 [Bacillota bacterium]|nr:hypothetical protein [Bacillota bacterium]